RGQVFVAERPVFPVTVKRRRLQIKIAQPQADSPPDVGAASRHAQPSLPTEGLVVGGSVRLFEVVAKPVVGVLVARPQLRLHGARLADQLRGAIAVLEVEGTLVLAEVFVAVLAAGVHQGHLEPGLRQPFAGPPARGARAYHDHVELTLRLVSHQTSSGFIGATYDLAGPNL